jgi:PAS domain S-box-containing protein
MKFLHEASIKRKQMFTVLLSTGMALLLSCVAFTVYEVAAFRREMTEQLSSLAELIGHHSITALDFDDARSADDILSALRGKDEIVSACIYGKDGNILAQYRRAKDAVGAEPPARPQSAGHSFRRGNLLLFQPVMRDGETLGVVYLMSDSRNLDLRLVQFAFISMVVFSLALLSAFMLSFRLQRLITEPVRELVRTTRAVAKDKNYSIRLPKRSADEIGALIEGFNEMLSQIQERDANLERRVEERTTQLRQENADRRRAEDALHASQALYHSLVEQLPVGVFRKDGEGRYVFVNPWFCRLKKVAPAHFLGKTPAEVAQLELEARTGAKTKITELAGLGADHHRLIMEKGGQIEREEHYPAEPGKEEQYLHVLKSPVTDADGKIVGSQGILIDITRRKEAEAELEKVHRQLLDISRQAGMAEVATSVLHNVGNVLNSINVSITLVAETIRKSRTSSLDRLTDVLNEHQHDLADFLTTDPKGKRFPSYIAGLTDYLKSERKMLLSEVESTRRHVEHVKDIVAMQQSYARVAGVTEKVKVVDLVEDALRMNVGALARHEVEVVRDYPATAPEITVEKHKVLQILVNLIRNAKYACDESGRRDKRMTLQVSAEASRINIVVIDNGVGIPAENLNRIFNHGFTTRQKGHGFGLHSGALAAREMGGKLTARSDGSGAGATFTLELPLQPPATHA